jgi:hypothetical protein
MKKILIIAALVLSNFLCGTTYAQVSFRVNISNQPIWGPVGYDHVEYYYLPDIDAYYYVPRHRYYFMENGNWRSGSSLPPRYREYDIYNGRKVVVNEPKPYLRHNEYKARYASSNEHAIQPSIRDSHEGRYFENKHHPEHSKWKEYKKNQNRHQDHDHDNGQRRN